MGKSIHTVAFTGHRHIKREDALRIPSTLEAIIEKLAMQGALVFRTGGAVGFDTVAALTVLDVMERRPELDLELELILPCRDQTSGWNDAAVRTYEYILRHATRHVYLYDSYTKGCMLARDRKLIDGADVCVAYCNKSSGGTAYTCAYALKKGVELINICDMSDIS